MARRVLPLEQLSKDAQKAFEIAQQASDIACALVLASFVDQCLGALIETFMIESTLATEMLDPRGGGIGTLEARARLAYVLGLIPKPLYQNIDAVARVRNYFAHSHMDIKFEDPAIQPLCDALVLPTIDFIAPDDQERERIKADFIAMLNTPRMKYVFNCVFMADHLMKLGRTTTRRVPTTAGWPGPAA